METLLVILFALFTFFVGGLAGTVVSTNSDRNFINRLDSICRGDIVVSAQKDKTLVECKGDDEGQKQFLGLEELNNDVNFEVKR